MTEQAPPPPDPVELELDTVKGRGSSPSLVDHYKSSANQRLWHVVMLVSEIIVLGALALVLPFMWLAVTVLTFWHVGCILAISGVDIKDFTNHLKEQ